MSFLILKVLTRQSLQHWKVILCSAMGKSAPSPDKLAPLMLKAGLQKFRSAKFVMTLHYECPVCFSNKTRTAWACQLDVFEKMSPTTKCGVCVCNIPEMIETRRGFFKNAFYGRLHADEL